uniref:Putative lipocalin-6 1 n=1 Tax=Amblyomma triste TaxID=251400 RepID=A0A023GB88_AMBTT
MAALSWLIFLAYLIKVFGAESLPGCSCKGVNGDCRDGFQVLQVGVIFRLVLTTFRSLSSDTFTCVITKTTQKDEEQHQVTEEVRYMVSDSFTQTYSFTQRFQFTCESGLYNKMSSIDNTTVPHASYQFLWTDPNCVVVEYLKGQGDQEGEDGEETNNENGERPNENQKEEIQAEARDSNTDCAKQAPRDCMLWVQGLTTEPSTECEEKFRLLCGAFARRKFGKLGCDALFNVAKHE